MDTEKEKTVDFGKLGSTASMKEYFFVLTLGYALTWSFLSLLEALGIEFNTSPGTLACSLYVSVMLIALRALFRWFVYTL